MLRAKVQLTKFLEPIRFRFSRQRGGDGDRYFQPHLHMCHIHAGHARARSCTVSLDKIRHGINIRISRSLKPVLDQITIEWVAMYIAAFRTAAGLPVCRWRVMMRALPCYYRPRGVPGRGDITGGAQGGPHYIDQHRENDARRRAHDAMLRHDRCEVLPLRPLQRQSRYCSARRGRRGGVRGGARARRTASSPG